jgi:Ca2+-binding RTX toxin-like protein
MATFNASTSKLGTAIVPYVAALPYVEIDYDSIKYTSLTMQGSGVVFEDGVDHLVQFTYYGRFNYSSERSLLDSRVTGFNLAGPTAGAFSAQGLTLQFRDFMGDPSVAAAKMLQGHDQITGSSFNDTLDGHVGDDVIYGGAGNDFIIGGSGRNDLYGQSGVDTFRIDLGSGPAWFNAKYAPRNGFVLDAITTGKGKRKQVNVLVDRDYNVLSDFSLAEDMLQYGGMSSAGVQYLPANEADIRGGTATGLVFFAPNSNNVIGYLPGVTEQMYLANGGLQEAI